MTKFEAWVAVLAAPDEPALMGRRGSRLTAPATDASKAAALAWLLRATVQYRILEARGDLVHD